MDSFVIGPGQEDRLASMLGRGAQLPDGCEFAGGGVNGATVVGEFRCNGGKVTVELRHPSRAPVGAIVTGSFALLVDGSAAPGLLRVLEARIRGAEAGFEWVQPQPTPSPSPPASPADPLLPSPQPETMTKLVVLALGLLALGLAAPRALSVAADIGKGLRVGWRRPEVRWSLVILVVASALRLGLSLINRQSNDNHFEVAEKILAAEWSPPPSSACMECSHAKLFHYAMAVAYWLTPDFETARLVSHLMNGVAGLALTVIFLMVAQRSAAAPRVRLLGFAMIALNAAIVGVYGQATNDGFVILFGSLAIVWLDRFCAGGGFRAVAALTGFLILGALSKASGWVLFAAIVCLLLVKALAAATRSQRSNELRGRKRFALAAVTVWAGFLLTVPWFNPYRENLLGSGTPFVHDAYEEPLNRIEVARPASWFVEDLLTFRLIELLRVPYTDFDPASSTHRTSLWSALYGRTFSLRFDHGLWFNPDPHLLWLGRACLALGLLPLAALLTGVAGTLARLRNGLRRSGWRWLADDSEWHDLALIGAMLGGIIAMVVHNHHLMVVVTWMKTIYLLPVAVPLFRLFLRGLDRIRERWPRMVDSWMIALVAVSSADLLWLLHDLLGP